MAIAAKQRQVKEEKEMKKKFNKPRIDTIFLPVGVGQSFATVLDWTRS
jgi:hypothetical protein